MKGEPDESVKTETFQQHSYWRRLGINCTSLHTVKNYSSSMQEKFAEAIELVLAENYRVLQLAIQLQIEQFGKRIIDSNHIFVCGEGRSGLVARMIAMRLMHLGCQVYVVGETTTPSIKTNDLLIRACQAVDLVYACRN